jgi:glyceraldehyde 3-phosphate dehydrogenase
MGTVAIHGFGRIGRSTLKAAVKHRRFVPVSISDIKELPTLAALFAVDTTYGLWPQSVTVTGGQLRIGDEATQFVDSTQALSEWQALEA